MPDIVEVVRGFYDAVNRRDLDAAMKAFAADAEWHQITAVPDRSVFRGADTIRTFLQSLIDDFGLRAEVESFVFAGDHVTALGKLHGRTTTGLDMEFALVQVWRLEDDRCVWLYDCCGTERGA